MFLLLHSNATINAPHPRRPHKCERAQARAQKFPDPPDMPSPSSKDVTHTTEASLTDLRMHVAAAACFIIADVIGAELLGAVGGICRAAATKLSRSRITLQLKNTSDISQ